jgi:NCS1 nucleoside transporter family
MASSVLTTGLSTTDAILITFCAALCNAIPTILNGAIGADLHIPFPIAARASFGYWLSYFCVISRGILALFWFGIQSAYGGKCVTVIVTAIWPSFVHMNNHLPASAGITTQGMISYFVYCAVQFPFMLVPTHKLQYLFYAKTILVLPTALAMVIWITVKAGHNPNDFFQQPPSVHGAERAWLWVSAMTSITGGFSTLAVNIMDFSRVAIADNPVVQVHRSRLRCCRGRCGQRNLWRDPLVAAGYHHEVAGYSWRTSGGVLRRLGVVPGTDLNEHQLQQYLVWQWYVCTLTGPVR